MSTGVTFGASAEGPGVTLAQLNEVTERATEEALRTGVDPATIEPKIVARIGGKIRSIEIKVPAAPKQ